MRVWGASGGPRLHPGALGGTLGGLEPPFGGGAPVGEPRATLAGRGAPSESTFVKQQSKPTWANRCRCRCCSLGLLLLFLSGPVLWNIAAEKVGWGLWGPTGADGGPLETTLDVQTAFHNHWFRVVNVYILLGGW